MPRVNNFAEDELRTAVASKDERLRASAVRRHT